MPNGAQFIMLHTNFQRRLTYSYLDIGSLVLIVMMCMSQMGKFHESMTERWNKIVENVVPKIVVGINRWQH